MASVGEAAGGCQIEGLGPRIGQQVGEPSTKLLVQGELEPIIPARSDVPRVEGLDDIREWGALPWIPGPRAPGHVVNPPARWPGVRQTTEIADRNADGRV